VAAHDLLHLPFLEVLVVGHDLLDLLPLVAVGDNARYFPFFERNKTSALLRLQASDSPVL
jgi:hypothetical protein